MKPPESIKINKISDVITITYESKIKGRRLPRRDVHESEMFPMTGFIKARDSIKIPNIESTLFGNPKAIIYNIKYNHLNTITKILIFKPINNGINTFCAIFNGTCIEDAAPQIAKILNGFI